MSLAMDGVVRRAPVMAPVRMPKLNPVTTSGQAQAAGGVRYVTGMDGIRRAVPMTPARQMLANMQAPAMVAAEAPLEVTPNLAPQTEVYGSRGWGRQIGFGLVASALIASGAYAWQASNARPISAAQALNATSSLGAAPNSNPAAAAAAQALTQQQTALQNLLTQFTAGRESKLGIVVKDLKTGATSSVNADSSMTSASLYKLFVAEQVYAQVDNGQLTLGNDAGGGSGKNVEDCLRVMINISDNTCGRALGSILNWGDQDSALKAAGYTGTSLQSPQQTSAKDVAMLFDRLYRGTLNSPTSNGRFMDLLKDQRVNNRLPAGLPAGTTIAHKTGDLDGYMHDAGIVYGPKTDYLVVMMGMPGTSPAEFSDLSTKLWGFFQN